MTERPAPWPAPISSRPGPRAPPGLLPIRLHGLPPAWETRFLAGLHGTVLSLFVLVTAPFLPLGVGVAWEAVTRLAGVVLAALSRGMIEPWLLQAPTVELARGVFLLGALVAAGGVLAGLLRRALPRLMPTYSEDPDLLRRYLDTSLVVIAVTLPAARWLLGAALAPGTWLGMCVLLPLWIRHRTLEAPPAALPVGEGAVRPRITEGPPATAAPALPGAGEPGLGVVPEPTAPDPLAAPEPSWSPRMPASPFHPPALRDLAPRTPILQDLAAGGGLMVAGFGLTVWTVGIQWSWCAFGPLPRLASARLFLSEGALENPALVLRWFTGVLRGDLGWVLGAAVAVVTLAPLTLAVGRWLRTRLPRLPAPLLTGALLAPVAWCLWELVGGVQRLLGWASTYPGLEALVASGGSLLAALVLATLAPHLVATWLALRRPAPGLEPEAARATGYISGSSGPESPSTPTSG